MNTQLKQGVQVVAAYRAKEFVRNAIRTAPDLGKGKGPMNLTGK